MGKISNYASALKAKLTDFFVIASDNNGVLETKKVTTEQIGDAVASDQVHSSLDTSDKTLIGAINEEASNIGTLSSLTTTDKSSLVGAVNEVNLPLFKITQFTKTYSISANGRVSFDRSFITIPSGYSIGGIVEATTGQGSCALVSVRPNNTSQWAFEIVNTSAAAYSNQTFTISILFVKTSKVN